MKFWFSCEADIDIAEPYRAARALLEKSLNLGLAKTACGQVREWTVIFIIRAEDSPDYEEVTRYHAKRRVAEFRLKVDHAQFKRATPEDQIRLLLDVVLRSVREAGGVVPEGVDLDELEGAILRVASVQGWSASKRGTKGRSS